MPDQTIYQQPRRMGRAGETVVTSTCGHNCGGRCVVNAHVVDDRIVKISTDPARWQPELPPLHACARGVGQIERVYHPDRLKYPMRRVGPRNSGQFERISWDEALDHVAAELLRIRQTHGNAAILDCSRSGNTSMLHGFGVPKRFFYKFGGCTELWSNMSAEAEIFAVRMTYGAKADYKSAGREPTDYVNSKLILMWGWSPADGTFGTGTQQYLKEAKKKGVRIVCVDPRRTRTSAALADEHIFIKPSTDAAALIAMAYVIVSEGLHDQAYCDRHVLGFDESHLPEGAPAGASYKSYLLGESDGVPKTPEWAAALCGMPAETIRRLAIEFATTKPAALQCGYAPGRTAFGEQFHRAAYALAAITGNVGIVGGNSGVSNGATGRAGIKSLPPGTNPIKSKVSTPLLADLLARGKAGGYPADIKAIYSAGGDLFNQCPNANKMAASLDGVELIVVQDHFMTPTARHADIVLPATTFWERNDVHTPWAGAGHYAIFMKQAIQPMYECRNDMDIFADLAARVGINDYAEKTEMEWLRELTSRVGRRFRHLRRKGRGALRSAQGRGGLRGADPRSRGQQVHDAVGQDRDLLDGAGGQSRPVRPGPYPAHSDLDRAGEARGEISADAVQPEVAGAHPFDPRQPAAAGAGRPRRRLDEHRRRRPTRHLERREGARLQRPRLDRAAGESHQPHRAGRRLDQGRRLDNAGQ